MNISRRIILWSALAYLACTAHALCDAPAKPVYMIRYHTNGWKTEVFVNGVRILKKDQGGGQMPIENLVVNGANKLTVKATQTDKNAQPLDVVLLSTDEYTGQEATLSDCAGTPAKAGTTAEKTIDFQAVVPLQWIWEKAEDVKALTAADQDAIYQKIKKLTDSLNAKDPGAHNQLRAVFLEETSRFEKIDHDRIETMSNDVYKKLFESGISPWEVKDKDQLDIESFGRITVVSAKAPEPDDWTITLKLPGGQNYSFHDLLFSRFSGQWVLIN